jgi:pantoate--beta-alanine ligase
MGQTMRQVDTIEQLKAARQELNGRVGLVPTMGALHEGHLALVKAAREDTDHVIATIFINPTQFGPSDDFGAYPRNLERDLDMLERAGVEWVFTPTPDEIYPAGFQTFINVEVVATGLEGDRRPGHFKGVTTVVAKLFNLARPEMAYFGQKDAQQVVVLRRMARDLNFPVEIVVCPTVREPDGLAMSSRNAYLTMAQREAASVLYRALRETNKAYEQGERLPAVLRSIARRVLASEPLAEVDYVAVNDPHTLFGIHEATDKAILFSLVVKIGQPHLLDNCLLPWSLNDREGLTKTLGT